MSNNNFNKLPLRAGVKGWIQAFALYCAIVLFFLVLSCFAPPILPLVLVIAICILPVFVFGIISEAMYGKRRDKNIASLLAFWLGSFGIHKAYLDRSSDGASEDMIAAWLRFMVSGFFSFCAFTIVFFNILTHGELLSRYAGLIAFILCIPFFIMIGLGIKDGRKLSAMSDDEFQKIYNKDIVDKTDKEHNDFNDAVEFLIRRKKNQ